MTTATLADPATATAKPPSLDDLVERLGGISLSRILAQPAPGTATQADLIEAERQYGRLYELVDGVLLEKAMGFSESLLAATLIQILRNFVVPRNLGIVSGPDGSIRLFPGLVRIPDVAFISWDRLPERRVPKEPIPSLVPELVIEILSESNTEGEMKRKRRDFFTAGVKLIWEFEPNARAVAAYTPDGTVTWLSSSDVLSGGEVLSGFTMQIGDLFSELDRHG